MLKRPIKVGDLVLVKGYGSTYYQQAVIAKIAKVNVYVDLNYKDWKYDSDARRWITTSGEKSMARRSEEVIVINEQLEHNKKAYPEMYI